MINDNYFFIQLSELLTNSYLQLTEKMNIREIVVDQIDFKDKNILNYHCKTGSICIDIAKARPDANVIGVDTNYKFIQYTKRKKRKNFTRNLEIMNLSNLHTTIAYFDVVVVCFAFSVMKIEEIYESIKDIGKLLNDKKKLIILEYSSPKNKITSFISHLYYKISLKKNIISFLKLDFRDILKHNGFCDILIKEFNGTKLITSTKKPV